MATFSKTLGIGVVAALMLASIAVGARGQVPGGGAGSFGGEGRALMQIRGKVVCAACRLDEVREAQPNAHRLYQLSYKQGQIVMQVTAVNESVRFDALAWPPRLWVRATESLLQQLSAEENLFREVEITGLLNNTRTLDIFAVTIHG